jgi:hypothetical protein
MAKIEEQVKTKKHMGNPAWKKGVSGNPGGRPKGSISLSIIVQEKLKEHPVIDGQKSKRSWAELIVEGWLRNALKNPLYFKELMERVDGKVVNPVDVTTKGKELGNGHIEIPDEVFRDALVILNQSGIDISPN